MKKKPGPFSESFEFSIVSKLKHPTDNIRNRIDEKQGKIETNLLGV